MKLSLLVVMLTVAVCLSSAESPAVPIAYSVTLEMKHGMLAALDVEVRFRGNGDGVTRLRLPEEFAGQTNLWRQVRDLKVDGAQISDASPSVRILRHKPSALLVVSY